MTQIDLSKLRTLLAEATPEPWYAFHCFDAHEETEGEPACIASDENGDKPILWAHIICKRGNAEVDLIVALRNAAEGMCDEIDSLRRERDALLAEVDAWHKHRVSMIETLRTVGLAEVELGTIEQSIADGKGTTT